MNSIEAIWDNLEKEDQRGGSRRVYDERGHDFFGAISVDGSRGLQLLAVEPPPVPPEFDLVDIIVGQRLDKKWLVSIWLREPTLTAVFGSLCDSLVESGKGIPADELAAFVFARLLSWQRLLEAGRGGLLGVNAVRGLIAEMLVLAECLLRWPAEIVVEGWVGPMKAPQDFVLPTVSIEAKAVLRSAPTVQISSIEQLDVPEATKLRLAVASLVPFAAEQPPSFSLTSLITDVRSQLRQEPKALKSFENRLTASGYSENKVYEDARFRLQGLSYYDVRGEFPRLRRAAMPSELTKASYEINIGACGRFKVDLEAS